MQLISTLYGALDFDLAKEDAAIRHSKIDLPRYIRWLIATVTATLQQRIVDWILTLGFEQDLYREAELPALYHYKYTRTLWQRERLGCVLDVGRHHRMAFAGQGPSDPSMARLLIQRQTLLKLEEMVMQALSTVRRTSPALISSART